jgi:glycogen debranching enzyme
MTTSRDEHLIHIRSNASDDRSRVLKHGETFGIFDRFGDIPPIESGDRGLYHEGTRFLSHFMFRLAGVRPLLLNSSITADNCMLVVDLTNPELPPPYQDEVIPQDTLHVVRSKMLHDQSCFERIEISNYGTTAAAFSLSWDFGADFGDIFEVRGIERALRGTAEAPSVTEASVELSYRGLDDMWRHTRLSFDPAPVALTEEGARFDLTLGPAETQAFEVVVRCSVSEPGARTTPFRAPTFEQASHRATEELDAARREWATISTSNPSFNDWLARSGADLRMMVTQTDSGPYIYAGVPWFSAPFGRDGIIAALESLTVSPALSAGVLRYLAATQASEFDPQRDAEPGKVLHEARGGEMAALGEIPFQQYYGSVDATPLFLVLANAYHQRTGDDALIDEIWPNLLAALVWIERFGDVDKDGFVEYAPSAEHGLVNQGWKDSHDSIFHGDGRLARSPIALVEVQGYVFAARLAMAQLAASRGEGELARTQRREAASLRRRFDSQFWSSALNSYVVALDADKAPCEIRTSNAGHALFTGIARRRRAVQLAQSLFDTDMFSGWGIRTLSSTAPRFNPMSYHNGSIWPHDNALIASGLSRYGYNLQAVRLLSAMFDVAQHMDLKRMPELFCGFARREGQGPTQYPVACLPQSWAAGALFMLLDACLGLSIDGPSQTIRLMQPALPGFIDQLTIEGLSVGNAEVDIQLQRKDGSVQVALARSTGTVDLLLQQS